MNGLRLWTRFIRIHIRSSLEYPASFWMAALSQFTASFLHIVGVFLMFSFFGSLRGWSFWETALVAGIVQTAVLFPLAAYAYGLRGLVIVLFLLLAACAAWYVFTPRANAADVAITVFGPLYTSLTFSSLVMVRVFDGGLTGATLTFGVMLSVWANDALAYVVGSRLGAHKLAPRISPHKSWEGFYGGIVASVVVWVAMAAYGVADLETPLAITGGLFVGIASVVGDLFESRLKRGVGVKDSGNFMPGHGGLLDRSDSMLFGSMAEYFVLFFGGIL